MKRPAPVDPRTAARLNECIALYRKGDAAGALAGVQKVLAKLPGQPDANLIASVAMIALNRPEQALYHAERAAKAEPANGRHRLAVGTALMALERPTEAIGAYRAGLERLPGDPEALAGLGSALARSGSYAEAEAVLRRAAGARPGWPDPVLTLGAMLLGTARAHDAVEALRPLVESDPRQAPAADTLALASSYDDAIGPEEAFALHALYGRCVEALVPRIGAHANTREPGRRIRIGYLSAELRSHSNSFFLRPILAHRDRDRFEVVCYHASRHEDAVTAELRSLVDGWVACDQLNPLQLAQRIHRDRVDVLVELTGHFARNRLPTMAARPAPVQVTYLGYGNTTGLTTIDARIVDHDTDPAPEADALATERLVRLDRCFLAYRPDDDAPEPGEPAPDRPFTFGSFNDVKKLSPSVVRVWAAVLDRCPGARLLIKTGELSHASMRDLLAARFAEHGVGPDRLTLMGRVDPERAHLALYDQMDLALDTFPYAGTTTTCQALWQGVPVLTLAGRAHAGRVGVSLLRTAGEDGLIAPDEGAYVELACAAFERGKLARAERLARRERLRTTPLLDHAGHAKALERAYLELWERWCAGGTAR